MYTIKVKMALGSNIHKTCNLLSNHNFTIFLEDCITNMYVDVSHVNFTNTKLDEGMMFVCIYNGHKLPKGYQKLFQTIEEEPNIIEYVITKKVRRT